MDLVKSYDSEVDDSDIEEIKVPSSPSMAKVAKEVDVINLDSDSEEESPVKETCSVTPKLPDKKLLPNSNQKIDCIDLENNDNSIDASNKETQPEKKSNVVSDSAEKKIDYLNLDSDSDTTEFESNNNDMNTLIDSASKLSDIPVGPEKPSNVPEPFKNFTENISLGKEVDKVPVSNLSVDDAFCNSSRNTPDFPQCSTPCDSAENSILEPSRKHFKADYTVETKSFQNDLDNYKLESSVPPLFREDYRVIPETENLLCRIPRQIVQTHPTAHTNIITSLNWCIKKFSYLFLSSSLDGSIKVWDLFQKNYVQCINSNSGLSAAKWSLDGGQIVAGGKGKKAFIYDVESGAKLVEYDAYNIVTSIEVHPYMEDVFLCGTRNAIFGFDARVNATLPIRAFFSKCEEVLDMAFVDESQFICSTNIVSRDSADRTIMVWHFGSGAKLSNQIYLERFTCPSIKVHPYDSSFIAQSNGNYIASFSANRPYTMKNKRYMGHKVAGYGIECDISPDGKYVVSGDAEGSVHFYNCSNANTVFVAPYERKIPINRVKWHPAQSSTVLTSTYDGQIHIWK